LYANDAKIVRSRDAQYNTKESLRNTKVARPLTLLIYNLVKIFLLVRGEIKFVVVVSEEICGRR